MFTKTAKYRSMACFHKSRISGSATNYAIMHIVISLLVLKTDTVRKW